MDWKSFFAENCNDTKLMFFNPISQKQLEQLESELGVKMSGDLLEALQQTNGIRDKGDFYLYTSEGMIEKYLDHLEFLKDLEFEAPCKILFFADNGCGEGFGFKISHGIIETEEVGVYYPIENAFRIVAPDFRTWVKEWYSGDLGT